MRATIRNYLEAMKQRREEDGEKGFSLIELIIVVVILGILVAIAVPIFVNIQQVAAQNAVKAAAANGATAAAAAIAGTGISGVTAVSPAAAASSAGDDTITVNLSAGSTTVSNVCVTASNGSFSWSAGPGVGGTATAPTCP